MTVSNTKQWSVWKRWLGKQTEESVLPPCLVVYWQSNRSVVSLSGTLFNFSYDIRRSCCLEFCLAIIGTLLL